MYRPVTGLNDYYYLKKVDCMRPAGPAKIYLSMTREKADLVRSEYRPGKITQKQLAAKHGISQAAVARIISGETWA